jgi:general secretion pathway protein D
VTTRSVRVAVGLLLVLGLLGSCATYRYGRRATDAVQAQNWDAAVYFYLEALARDPGNVHYKMALQRARLKASQEHFRRGMSFKAVGELQRAESELELAVQFDPTHQYAEVELEKVRKDIAVLDQEGGPTKLAEIKKAASEMKVKPPVLNPASNEPMSLSFPNPTNVRDIYKAIGQAFGINILFDNKMRDQKLSIELKNVTAREALESVMQAAGHFYKVLDPKTVIVVEDTPQNRRDYEDLVVKTFFLSNADVKDISNMLRALIDARRIAINEQLNSIVIRDTADKVAIAERLINANDKAKAEVLVDVELLQVDTNKLRDIGMSLSSQTFQSTFDATKLGGATSTSAIPLTQLGNVTRSMWSMAVPNVVLNLIKTAGETETLAHPQLRITEREKANLVIGQKVPIPSTTFNTTQTIGGNIVPITAFTYQDVGIKLDIEPKVHHNNEVTLKLKVEVSDLGTAIQVSGQPNQYPINTRSIDTVIRLKDGETSLLAGLLKETKATTSSGLPWLSDIPVLGRLFGDTSKQVTQTDLILTLTPHIIRYPDITEEDLAPLWVGTENRITIFGNSPRVRSAVNANPLGGAVPPPPPGLGLPGGLGEAPQTEVPEVRAPAPVPSRPRIRLPGTGTAPVPGGTATQSTTPDGSASNQDAGQGTGVSAQTVAATALAADPNGLPTITFYPARLPAVVGSEAVMQVVLDPGVSGMTGPLHFAYDPARLEVTRLEGGVLPGSDGEVQVQVSHTPTLGWITLAWSGRVTGSGTLLNMVVRPHEAGELPLIFAGPVGAVVARNGTVVAVSPAPGGGGQ